jgi:hypothetical protein
MDVAMGLGGPRRQHSKTKRMRDYQINKAKNGENYVGYAKLI